MKQQRGGTLLGFILGVVVGLGTALAVAVYVTKVPIPFIDKGPSRSNDQNAAETQKNSGWDPNAPLYGKNLVRPVAPAAPQEAASAPVAADGVNATQPKTDAKPAASADPLGDLAKARASASTAEPFTYLVQVGAFRTAEDAESQRARLSLGGTESRVSEREQSGRTVYRVRVGPFATKDEADATKARLDASGLETALVRVAR